MSHDGSAPLWRLLGLLDKVKKSGTGYEARCPGTRHKNEDKHPSLSLGLGYDGRVLLNCHAGCDTDDVLAAVGLAWTDLFEKSSTGNVVRRYRLMNGAGTVVAEHVREELTGDKKLWWEHGGKAGLNGTPLADLPLYRQPELENTAANVPVIVTEGEKAADALAELGLLAVGTVTGAAGTPSAAVLSILVGREVWLWPDNDDVGRQHMERIARQLSGVVRWVDWKQAPPGGDGADYAAGGGTAEGVAALLRQTAVAPGSSNGPRIWHGDELARATFDPVRWAIPGILPSGLTILAGRPKLGKSWLVLGWALDVAAGTLVLKRIDINKGITLYLALEDSPRRMQERMHMMLGESPAPHGFNVVTSWPRMGEGGIELLEDWLDENPDCRLVMIDTFKRFRPIEKGGRNSRLYDLDYDAVQPVAELAQRRNVAIVLVMHTNKTDPVDPVDLVSGTLGLSGAADGVLVLKRERGQADASLFVTGRDVEEQDLALKWEKDDLLCWVLLGDAEHFRQSKERRELLDTVIAQPGMKATEIAGALGKTPNNVRQLLFKMTHDGQLRLKDSAYWPPSLEPTDNTDNTANAANPERTVTPPVTVTPHLTTPVTAVIGVTPITPITAVIGGGRVEAGQARPPVIGVIGVTPVRGVSGVRPQIQKDHCIVCGEPRTDHTPEEQSSGCKRRPDLHA